MYKFFCALIAFLLASQWKCENLFSEKQPNSPKRAHPSGINFNVKRECIPVGCVLPAAVAVRGGGSVAGQFPSTFPLGVGLDQIPLNFPLGCGSGSDPPPIFPLRAGLEIPPGARHSLDQAPPGPGTPWTKLPPGTRHHPGTRHPPGPGTPRTRQPPWTRHPQDQSPPRIRHPWDQASPWN